VQDTRLAAIAHDLSSRAVAQRHARSRAHSHAIDVHAAYDGARNSANSGAHDHLRELSLRTPQPVSTHQPHREDVFATPQPGGGEQWGTPEIQDGVPYGLIEGPGGLVALEGYREREAEGKGKWERGVERETVRETEGVGGREWGMAKEIEELEALCEQRSAGFDPQYPPPFHLPTSLHLLWLILHSNFMQPKGICRQTGAGIAHPFRRLIKSFNFSNQIKL
jgi:hypothetical protein